jgi:hypothetical protein
MTRTYHENGSFRPISLTAFPQHTYTLSILTQLNLNILSNSIKTKIGTKPTDYLTSTHTE